MAWVDWLTLMHNCPGDANHDNLFAEADHSDAGKKETAPGMASAGSSHSASLV
jgi:hypothetical protein